MSIVSVDTARFDKIDREMAGLRASVNAQADLLVLLRRNINTMSDSIQTRLDTLTREVSDLDAIKESVVAFVNGVPELIRAAVAEATAAGATPAQLAAFDTLNAALDAKANEIAAAVATNTPEEPPAA